jgi:hypothetical protein
VLFTFFLREERGEEGEWDEWGRRENVGPLFFVRPPPSHSSMWMWVYSRGHPFTLSRLVSFDSSADGWSNFRCLAVFPIIKVGQNWSLLLSWSILLFERNRYVFTEYVYSWGRRLTCNCFLSPFWFCVLSNKGSLKISFVERLQNQACFCISQLFLWVNHHIRKYLNFKHFQTKCKKKIFLPRGTCHHTGISSLIVWINKPRICVCFFYCFFFSLRRRCSNINLCLKCIVKPVWQ